MGGWVFLSRDLGVVNVVEWVGDESWERSQDTTAQVGFFLRPVVWVSPIGRRVLANVQSVSESSAGKLQRVVRRKESELG